VSEEEGEEDGSVKRKEGRVGRRSIHVMYEG
jgi:hypothetical protein